MSILFLTDVSWASYQIGKSAACACPGNAGNVFPPPTSKETAGQRSRHASRLVRDARAVMHVGIANPRWRGKRSRHFRRMRNPQFYVTGKRPMGEWLARWPPLWVAKRFFWDRGPGFEATHHHMKLFAHDWYLPCCQFTEICSHASFIHGKIISVNCKL